MPLLDSFSHWGSPRAFVIKRNYIKILCVISTVETTRPLFKLPLKLPLKLPQQLPVKLLVQVPANGVNGSSERTAMACASGVNSPD